MKKTIIIMLVISNVGFTQDLDFSGYVRNYSGMLAGNGSTDFVILQNTFSLNIEKRFDNSAFKINLLTYHDNSDSLTFTLREAYLDLYFDDFDLRVGKQQIVWGKADGVFITDIVSPKNLFQFLLPEFDEIRIGVIGAKFDYYIGDNTFELVWLSVFSPTILPRSNSIWAPELSFAVPHTFDYSQQNVNASLENSEIFAKYSALTEHIDFEIMAGYMWDDDPTMYSSLPPNVSSIMNLTLTPEHNRITLGGGSFSTTLGPLVLRGEGAYYLGKKFNSTNLMVNNGVIEKDYIHYMIGTDFNLFDINFSTQFIQKAIIDYDEVIAPNVLFKDEFNNMMTFLARYSTLNETLDLEFFSYYDFEYDGALIRPRMLYDYSDAINLQLGANIFTGTEGSFGQYNKNDMIYGKIIYSF
ncbi:MAG: hypothetical protein GY936_07995 [Ignavibacteriae bacterium]|nr:hypothetical protein [Ignavibacteriota bacterium]